MSALDAFPNGKLVAYDPKGQWDGTGYELGKVVGRSASKQYVYVDFNGDDLGAKAVSPALLMPLTPAGEGPDLPEDEAELEQAEYEAAVMAMVGLTVVDELDALRAPTWIYSSDVVEAIRGAGNGSDALRAIEQLVQRRAIHPVAAQVAAAIASLETTGHTVSGEVALHRVAGVHLEPDEVGSISLPVGLTVIGKRS